MKLLDISTAVVRGSKVSVLITTFEVMNLNLTSVLSKAMASNVKEPLTVF